MAGQAEIDRWLSLRERMPLVHVVGTGAGGFGEELVSLVLRNALPSFLRVHDPKQQFGDCWLPQANGACRLEEALAPVIRSVWIVAIGGKETMTQVPTPLSIWQPITFDITVMLILPTDATVEDLDAVAAGAASARELEPRPAIEIIEPERVQGAAWRLAGLMHKPAGMRRGMSGHSR